MLRRSLSKRLSHAGMIQATLSAGKHTNRASAYRVLGLPSNAIVADVKSAFYRQAKDVHPDSNRHNDVSSRSFVDIRRAYETLTRGLSYSAQDKPFIEIQPAKGEYGTKKNTDENWIKKKPNDQLCLYITMKQAQLGMKAYANVLVKTNCPMECYREKKIVVGEKCTICSGRGYVEKKRYILLDIPRGIQDGQTLLQKQPRGSPVEVTVCVTPYKEFFTSGNNIYSCQTIPLAEALLGGDILCRGIDGSQTIVKIQPGQDVVCLEGQGLCGRGDHLVQLVVKVSTKPSLFHSSVRKMFSDKGSNSKNVNVNGLMRRPDCSLVPQQTDKHIDAQKDLIKNFAIQSMYDHGKRINLESFQTYVVDNCYSKQVNFNFISGHYRKKLSTTPQYIYQALFKEGKSSDVTVCALGKLWKLHKVYLAQSPYFASMFSGAWREAREDVISIEIVDPKINLDALHTVLGSLYLDEITVEPAEVVSTLAAATLFQLEGVIDKCAEIMIETLNGKTAIPFYEAGTEYGIARVRDAALRWLLVNLLSYFNVEPESIKDISVDLMTKLVESPDLFVMQTEFSLYVFLKYWVYLQINPQWNFKTHDSLFESQQFFQNRKDEPPFLLTQEGKPYRPPFKALRFKHLINHHVDIEMLKTDNIIPMDWFTSTVFRQWNHILRLDSGLDRGPNMLSFEEFKDNCLRCGRILPTEGDHMWRWTGFNFGLDLVWTCDARTLRLKRQHRAENEMMLSLQSKRHLVMRITIACLDEQRQIKHTQSTGLKAVTLYKNEEVTIFTLDKELKYPLMLSVNVLTVTPAASVIDNSAENEAGSCAST